MVRTDVEYNCEWAVTGKKSIMQIKAGKYTVHTSHNFPEL